MLKRVLFISVLFSGLMFCQSAGNSGMSILKLGVGGRNVALGDIGSVMATDASAAFYNPAAIVSNTNSEVMFMHNEWIQDVRSEVAGAKCEFLGIPLAALVNVTTVSDIEVRTKPGEALTTFNANYFYGGISSGFSIMEGLDLGATVKFLYEGIYSNNASGSAFDFGVRYKTSVKGLSVSSVIKNLGSMTVLGSEKTKLPSDFRLGAGYNYVLENSDFQINAGAEFQKYLPTDDSHINVGGEVIYNNIIALRCGYQSGYESKSFSGGLGVIWGALSFDYAFSPFSYQLGTGNTISLNFRF